nr:MAG TPA: Large Terminase [Caudoviricetes sp.]
MTKCKYIDDYMQGIRSGEIKASKRLHKAMDYIDRKLSPPADVRIDTDKTEKAIELIERYFEMTLLPWERFIIALVHCYYRQNDTVVFDEFFIMMGRGNGKNGFISGLAWYLTTKYHGVKGYNVDIIANSQDQAETSFNDIYTMLEDTWAKSKRFFYKSKEIIQNLNTRSYIKYNTSNARTKDGKRSACLIFDEEHEYENSKTIGVFQSGFGKRKHSRIFKITTNGYVRDGVLDDDLRLSDDVLDGIIPNSGLCPLIYEMNSFEECDDPDLWEQACPSINYFPELKKQMDKEFIEKAYKNQVRLDFYTKRMNLPMSGEETPVTDEENVQATNKPIPDLTGKNCVASIDYATINDFASANLHFKVDGVRYDINHSWLCLRSKDLNRLKIPWEDWAERGWLTLVDEKEINPDLIADWIAEQAQKYNIKRLALDNNRYALVTRSLRNIGFDRDVYKNVVCVRPNDISKAIPVIESAFTNQSFAWGDYPPLRWAVRNTKKETHGKKEGTDTGNFFYAKIESKSRKTDPWMAVVHGMCIENELDDGAEVICDDLPAFTW